MLSLTEFARVLLLANSDSALKPSVGIPQDICLTLSVATLR
jgi:hypothetical protein